MRVVIDFETFIYRSGKRSRTRYFQLGAVKFSDGNNFSDGNKGAESGSLREVPCVSKRVGLRPGKERTSKVSGVLSTKESGALREVACVSDDVSKICDVDLGEGKIGASARRADEISYFVDPFPEFEISGGADLLKIFDELNIRENPSINFWQKTLVRSAPKIFSPYFRRGMHQDEKCEALASIVIAGRQNTFGDLWCSTRVSLLRLHDMCGSLDIIAHNGSSFDFHILRGTAKRHGLQDLFKANRMVDSIKVFKEHFQKSVVDIPTSYSLETLHDTYIGSSYDAHLALADCHAVIRLWQKFLGSKKNLARESAPDKKGDRIPDLRNVLVLGGIGKKSAFILREMKITTIEDLFNFYKKRKTLKGIVPHWKKVEKNLRTVIKLTF